MLDPRPIDTDGVTLLCVRVYERPCGAATIAHSLYAMIGAVVLRQKPRSLRVRARRARACFPPQNMR